MDRINVYRLGTITFSALIWIGAALLVFLSVYPSLASSIQFLTYILLVNVLPGAFLTRWLLPEVNNPGSFLIYALNIGTIANALIFIPLWMLGVPGYLKYWPLLCVISLWPFGKHLRFEPLIRDWRPCFDLQLWVSSAVLVLGTTVALVLPGLPGNEHSAFQGVLVTSLALGWPPPNLLLPDVPLSYNYLAHLWLLGVHQNTDVTIPELVARYGNVFFPSSAMLAMLAFCSNVLKLPWWAGALAVAAVWWVSGVPSIIGTVFGIFTPLASVWIFSPAFGFMIFFVMLTLLVSFLRAQGTYIISFAVIAGLLTFAATGARGVTAPLMLSTLGLLGAVKISQKSASAYRLAWCFVSMTCGFVAGLFFFFTIGSDFTGMGFIQFTGQPFTFLSTQTMLTLPRLLIDFGIPSLTAGAIGFIVIVLFQAGFMTPGLFYHLKLMSKHGLSDTEWLLVGASVSGMAAVFLVVAPGYSHFTFLQYTNIAMSILGAEGLARAFSKRQSAIMLRGLLLGATACLALVQIREFPLTALRLASHKIEAAVNLVLLGIREVPEPIPWCVGNGSAPDLLAKAKASADNPIVIIVPSDKALGPCESFWATVLTPVQTVQLYSLFFLPGKGTGPLKLRLEEERKHIMSAYASALKGDLNTNELLAIASTLPRNREVFVLAPGNLRREKETSIKYSAKEGELVLLSISETSIQP
jgi:hypothetical protein